MLFSAHGVARHACQGSACVCVWWGAETSFEEALLRDLRASFDHRRSTGRGEHIEAPTSLGQEIDLLHPMRMAGRVGKRMVHQGVGAVGRQVSAESRQQEHDRLAIKRGACADRARSAPPRAPAADCRGVFGPRTHGQR